MPDSLVLLWHQLALDHSVVLKWDQLALDHSLVLHLDQVINNVGGTDG